VNAQVRSPISGLDTPLTLVMLSIAKYLSGRIHQSRAGLSNPATLARV